MHPTWHPLSQSVVKDLLKVLQECGHKSPYFQGLLNTNLSRSVIIPMDLKQLFRSICNKTEYKLWEATWKASLQDVHSLDSSKVWIPQLMREAMSSPWITYVVRASGFWLKCRPLTYPSLSWT